MQPVTGHGPGRLVAQAGQQSCPDSLSQETGANRQHQSFRVTKEECMRFLGICSSLIVLAALASASDIKLQILDPSGAAISGAQATLRVSNEQRIIAVQTSSAEGMVLFSGVT